MQNSSAIRCVSAGLLPWVQSGRDRFAADLFLLFPAISVSRYGRIDGSGCDRRRAPAQQHPFDVR